jgi:hypothetical protein
MSLFHLVNGGMLKVCSLAWVVAMHNLNCFSLKIDLYDIARVKDASVVDHLELFSDSHQWDVSIIKAVHDWEVDVFASFFKLLFSFILRWGGGDKLCWPPSKRGLFDVRSFYNVLVVHDSTPFP